jgi:hypothetical protein
MMYRQGMVIFRVNISRYRLKGRRRWEVSRLLLQIL